MLSAFFQQALKLHRLRWSLVGAAFCLALGGCNHDATTHNTAADQRKVVKLSSATPMRKQRRYEFPAIIRPVKTIDIQFEVNGRLTLIDLTTGNSVKKGQLIAAVDATPFELSVRENRALLKQSELELERIRALVAKGVASARELDNAKTQRDIRNIELAHSLEDLSRTRIHAPFDALVSQRMIENDSYIKAGDSIARLQDMSLIYFELNIPERLLSAAANSNLLSAQATVRRDEFNSSLMNLHYVEHNTEPDPITQTYKIIFAAKPEADMNITPGQRTLVEITIESKSSADGAFVPLSALASDKDDQFYVWRYNDAQGTVSPVAVTVIEHSGDEALVSGIEPETRVVSAGIGQMRDQLPVREYRPE